MNGTLTAVSYMFIGNVPLPLPHMPWWPMLMPLSAVNMTRVSSSMPRASSLSSTLPIFSSIADMAAK